jgi:N-methylhydantoinase A
MPHMIEGVRERLGFEGELVMPIDEEDVRRNIRKLVDRGAQIIVVCLVNSVVNPSHEKRVEQILLEEYPSHLLGSIPVILSHRVAGRKGEYVRATSAIIDGYLHSTMYHAMNQLEQNLRAHAYHKPMLLIHNSGGMAQLNSTDALQTIHSGPVSGISAAEHLAMEADLGSVIATDMGGTSYDIGIVVEGGIKHYDFNPVVDRWLVTVPMVHLVTLGAGGGSIAKYDSVFETVKVGPASAGSDPGPAAYDRGGMNPTVTDADLLMGYLDVKNYANGHIKLNMRRTYQALEDICDELDIEEIEAAKLIKANADGEMGSGLVQELNRQGYKAKDFVFLAYGGNGPLHACGIADRACIKRVLAPPYSSVFSACGGAGLDQMHIHEKNVSFPFFHKNTKAIFSDFDTFNDIVSDLQAKGRADLMRQGIREDKVQFRTELDMRYSIQKMEVSIVSPKPRLESSTDVIELIEFMNNDFSERYGEDNVSPESGVWVATVRVVSWVELPALKFEKMNPPTEKIVTPEPFSHRECHFVGVEGAMNTPIYDGQALKPGVVIEGPAVVNPGNTTYLVEPGWRFESAAQGAAWLIKED